MTDLERNAAGPGRRDELDPLLHRRRERLLDKHRQAYLQAFVPGAADLDLPVTNRLSDEVLSVPVRPNLGPNELEAVIAAIREVASPVGRPPVEAAPTPGGPP